MTDRQKALERLNAMQPPPIRKDRPKRAIKYAILFSVIMLLIMILLAI